MSGRVASVILVSVMGIIGGICFLSSKFLYRQIVLKLFTHEGSYTFAPLLKDHRDERAKAEELMYEGITCEVLCHSN
jgi:hypothetical protein